MESWGRPLETITTEEEAESCLLELLRADREYRWRYGTVELLRKCKGQDQCHRALLFLYSIANEGIKAKEKGTGANVDFNPSEAPECLCCADWLNIIHGLNFVTTSPGTVRDISYVDVQTGENTDGAVLQGFCFLLKCLGSMTWETFQAVLGLGEETGLHLYHTVSHVRNGYRLEHDSQNLLDRLKDSCPHLLCDLGFNIVGQNAKWQKPESMQTFENIRYTLGVLFTSADKMETAV